MAQIPFFELTAENAEASQMIHVVNRLIAAINRVIGPLPDPEPVDAGATGATGATGAAVHTAPAAHPNQRGTHR